MRATGLRFPEGPLWIGDRLFVVEIERGTLTPIDNLSEAIEVAWPGPNGAAVGNDGSVFICCNGGEAFKLHPKGWLLPDVNHDGTATFGAICRVDADLSNCEVLYRYCGGAPLNSPNDIAVASDGSLLFTDMGRRRGNLRDLGAVYRASPDGGSIERIIFPVETPNGIGLSPEGDRLYVAETITRSVLWWPVQDGVVQTRSDLPRSGGHLLAVVGRDCGLDSLAVDAEGNVLVGAVGRDSGVVVISPAGEVIETLVVDDPFPTNVCFGPDGSRTMYVTLSGSGRVVELPWHCDGAVNI